ncbi:MAG: hypothetical protein ACOCR1_04865 [Planctomycetota bacterium]
MNCKQARIAITKRLANDISEKVDSRLTSHLAECRKCRERLEKYRGVAEAVNRLSLPELPEEVSEACDELVDEARAAGHPDEQPPATPRPVAGMGRRMVILGMCLVGLLAMAIGTVLLVSRYTEPVEQSGIIVRRHGDLEMAHSRTGGWTEAPPQEEINEKSIFRTGPDALMKVQTSVALWHVDGDTTVMWPQPNKARLASGQLMVQAAPDSSTGITVSVPSGGTVKSEDGAFMIRATPTRILVTALAGETKVGSSQSQDSLTLEAGFQGMVNEGEILEKTRAVPLRGDPAWLQRFGMADLPDLPPAEASYLPQPSGDPARPSDLVIRQIDIKSRIKGPLVFVYGNVTVSNQSEQTREVALSPAEILWPPVLAQVSGNSGPIPPGETEVVETAAVGPFAPAGKELQLAVMPSGWAPNESTEINISISSPDSTSDTITCLTHETSSSNKTLQVDLDGRQSSRPIVFSADRQRLAQNSMVFLEGNDGPVGVGTWLPGFEPDSEAEEIKHFLLAMDASDHYEEGGRARAHGTAEHIMDRLAPQTRIMMAAHDGEVKALPAAGPRARRIARDRMLSTFWELEADGARPGLIPLLNWCLAFPARRPSVAFVMAGNTPEDGLSVRASEEDPPRTFLLSSDVESTATQVGRTCAETGGAVISTAGLTSRQIARYALQNLPWPGLTRLNLTVEEDARKALLTRPGTPSNAPVVFAIEPVGSDDRLTGRIRVATRSADRDVEVKVAPEDTLEFIPSTMAEQLAGRVVELIE